MYELIIDIVIDINKDQTLLDFDGDDLFTVAEAVGNITRPQGHFKIAVITESSGTSKSRFRCSSRLIDQEKNCSDILLTRVQRPQVENCVPRYDERNKRLQHSAYDLKVARVRVKCEDVFS
jgi:hypothetical protein